MRHRPPRPSPSAKVRRGFAGLSNRMSRRVGLMLALTLAVALTAGAALTQPTPQAGNGSAAQLRLAAAAGSAAQHTPGGRRNAAAGTSPVATTSAPSAANGMTGGAGSTSPATTAATDSAAPSTAAGSAPAAQSAGTARTDHRGDHRRQEPPVDTPPDAPAPNASCTLIVPPAPTTARGLTTPYQLTATDPEAGDCHEANADQSAFVEATVLNLDTGALGVYHPLVVDAGTAPAIAPVTVRLPAHAVVGVWFGFNGDTLTLGGKGARACVNGLDDSLFGQFAYCNAPAFFKGANAAIAAHKLAVPPLGTGTDGLPCPTTRDFSVVDQDQSDNLATSYRIVDGNMAQDIPAAGGGTKLTNGSDEGLLAKFIDPALGCTPWTAPDLTTGGATQVPALALNELSAAANQAAPAALVPTSDPMTQVDGETSEDKTNLYRAGVDQPALPAGQTPETYCADLSSIAPARFAQAREQFQNAASPDAGTSLDQFLQDRLTAALETLGCPNGG